jgi:hypothetical protein
MVAVQIQKLRDNLNKGNDDFTSGLERIEGLKSERDVLVRNVEFARFSLEESYRRAKKAEALYENAGNNMSESEGVGTRFLIFFALDPKLVPKPEV